MSTLTFRPAAALAGSVAVPPDKSLTHRAFLLGAISDRVVVVDNPLDSEDTYATLQAVRALGAGVEGSVSDDRVVITGRGIRGLTPPPVIDCMNAGTLMRLVAGILVGQSGDVTVLDGDDSLRGRPMRRIVDPLRAMGAELEPTDAGTPPLAVRTGRPLVGVVHDLPVASAQVKSCVLLAGLNAEGETWVREPVLSRDHTERMLEAAGVELLRRDGMVGVRGRARAPWHVPWPTPWVWATWTPAPCTGRSPFLPCAPGWMCPTARRLPTLPVNIPSRSSTAARAFACSSRATM